MATYRVIKSFFSVASLPLVSVTSNVSLLLSELVSVGTLKGWMLADDGGLGFVGN